ncbi:RNA polymerase I termination factor-like protein [Cladobotryum mycophilum]|uniref:RNA polymerase I termination factor-like protein n=1 Tax=Cladobotryum mycophilum TaxID=491253 RepID=A0ABR0SUR5_9HYPO
MPTNKKWPDFQLASKLRHFMGSQSGVPEGISTDKSSPLLSGTERERNYIDDSQDPGLDERIATMSDAEEPQVDAMEGLEDLPNDDVGADADADFGDLEMFDSNASPAPFAVQISQSLKSEEHSFPISSSASKRDKKKKGRVDAIAAEAITELETPGKKRKRSKKKSPQESEIADSLAANGELDQEQEHIPSPSMQLSQPSVEVETATSDMQAHELPTIPSTQTKKKRKVSDSAEGKRRKKRRANSDAAEDVVQGTQDELPTFDSMDTHATFLRTDRNSGADTLNAIDEEMDQDPDSQLSPSLARARRRSQSAGPRSRENSVPFRAAIAPMAPMAIDGLPRDAEIQDGEAMDTDTIHGLPTDDVADAAGLEPDVESIAREMWREHVSTQNEDEEAPASQNDTNADVAPEEPTQAEEPTESPKRRRSARTKKPKPTVAESTAVESSAEADPDMPEEPTSPSAKTQKRKTRGKTATKRSKGRPPKREKLSPVIQDEVEAEPTEEAGQADEDEEAAAQYRPDGYTQGRFSDDELSRISRAVERFRAEYNLTQFELNEMIHAPGGTTAGSAHAQLWLRLTAECPNRKRQKVINVTRKKFHNFVARGTWTAEQDLELAELIHVHGTTWSKIAGIINRHPEDVRDRYRNYIVCGTAQRKDVWDAEEEGRLTQHVKDAMEAIDELRQQKPDKVLLQKSYEELIDWQNISEKMDRTRSRLQCITKWKALNNRTRRRRNRKAEAKNGDSESPTNEPDDEATAKLELARQQLIAMGEEEQYRLVLAIHQTAAPSDAKIPWVKLVDKSFRSTWPRPAQQLLWHRLKQTVPDSEHKTVQQITQYIINGYNQSGGMPELDQIYDDARELEAIKQVRSRSTANGQQAKSAEIVHDSGAEDEEANQPTGVQVDDLEMHIDPALSQDPQLMQEPAPVEKPAPKKRAPAKKRSKKAAIEVQDPIEEAEPMLPEPVADAGEESNIEEEPRKRKTPSKFKSPSSASKDGEDNTPPQVPSSDSVMDDMEDLPARVPS